MGEHVYNIYAHQSPVEGSANQYPGNNEDDNHTAQYAHSPRAMDNHRAQYASSPRAPEIAFDPYSRPTQFSDSHLDSASSSTSETTNTYVDTTYHQQETTPEKKKKRHIKKSPRGTSKEVILESPYAGILSQTNLEEKRDFEVQKPLYNQKRMFSFLFSNKIDPITASEDRTGYPWLTANFISQIGFWWLGPILKKGYKRTLTADDLWTLPPNLRVKEMHEIYEGHVQRILVKARAKHAKSGKPPGEFIWPTHAVPWALFLTLKWEYTLSCVFLSIAFASQALSPLLTKEIIDFVQYRSFGLDIPMGRGVGLTVGSVVLIFFNGLLLNHCFHNAMLAGAQAKAILTKALLLKSFTLSAKSKYMFNHSRITSLMSTDLTRIDLACGYQPFIICFPIPVIIAIVILLINFGITSLAGIGLFVVSMFICIILTKYLYEARETMVKYTDERIALMREVLENMKIIKFYAWELAYRTSLTSVRKKETKYLFKIKLLRNFVTAYAVSLPTLTAMISYITMWATDRKKSPGKVFSSLTLFAILAQAIMLLPISCASAADAYIGFRRCRDFFSAAEFSAELEQKLLDSEDLFFLEPEASSEFEFKRESYGTDSIASEDAVSRETVIDIKNASYIWESFHDELDTAIWDLSIETKKARKLEKKRQQEQRKLMKMERSALQSYANSIKSVRNSVRNATTESFDSAQLQFPGLTNLDLTIYRGEFIIVTGVVGSGKSSLLQALAGFMKLDNPKTSKVKVEKDLILCSAPWIQNATVRENILFARPMDVKRYNQIIFACGLEEDLENLPAGDNTEIGERGITLSGGQKARINLARAVYSDAKVILLDDVISAVDARIGRHIINHLIKGLLKDRTVILATHQLGTVQSADRIVFLNGDGTVELGTVPELMQTNLNFERLIEYTQEHEEEVIPVTTSEEALAQPTALIPNLDLDGRTVLAEEAGENAISWNVYKQFIKLGNGSFGWSAAPVFFATMVLATFFQIFSNVWLSFWIERKFKDMSDKLYVSLYVTFAAVSVLFTTLEFTILALMNDLAAKLLHSEAVSKVLHAPMYFIDTNPLGRIMNRFTKDTDSVDNELGEQLRMFIFPLAIIIGIIILCICYLPWFAIAVPFLIFWFIFLASFYLSSAREVKRLESTQRSLVYNNINETLHGMATIQAFNAEQDFIDKNDRLLDRMNEAYYISIGSQRWLSVNLDIIICLFALIINICCITDQFHISASSTGLLLNYVTQIVALLSFTVRAMTLVESEMNSVERLHEYASYLPQEAAYKKTEFCPPSEWPASGYIQFDDVSLRYRPGLPMVLKGLNLSIYPGEKVGICGRTGAGKSSIMTALYRLTELETGSIFIDGLNIADMGLFDLRSNLSIIPQDPVLFQGSIRKNLDPFDQYQDSLLWDTLKRAGLFDEFSLQRARTTRYNPAKDVGYDDLHKFHLDQLVEEAGGNYSLGERQLITLARSLIRNSKILVLDEATSSVDFETDSKIQNTIANEFSKCTILCIAHRLKTILQYDRIIVIDQGEIIEKGVPWTLYNNNGVFRSMCESAHLTPDDF